VTNVPDSLGYTVDHEWVRDEGRGRWRVGIRDFAQAALGEVVFVELANVAAYGQARLANGRARVDEVRGRHSWPRSTEWSQR
jgi:glycine cleavage system H lipoate-binding protein